MTGKGLTLHKALRNNAWKSATDLFRGLNGLPPFNRGNTGGRVCLKVEPVHVTCHVLDDGMVEQQRFVRVPVGFAFMCDEWRVELHLLWKYRWTQ